jgi:hypothetical protein
MSPDVLFTEDFILLIEDDCVNMIAKKDDCVNTMVIKDDCINTMAIEDDKALPKLPCESKPKPEQDDELGNKPILTDNTEINQKLIA